MDVLLKSLAYFKVRSLEILGNSEIKAEMKKRYPEPSFSKDLKDLIYFDSVPNESFTELLDYIQIHNDTVILFNRIHSSSSEFEKWSRFVEDEKITVSIDLFHCGMVFIRREQAKQHFYIRI
ncbi:hypothetical protein [Flagellimonas allohymeniacidonis]|uniref:Uncharacterized protein n=1 Tax=Flagellimonas allohymeniacidonis TaxID=2517819 RepID=A0A4Q8QLE2_9FLAO|nr:hypothetical protein [Allomuricauda hymeniacidonis]TAI49359.1 hypothetical protein EW142_06060 [Allomuricauda hymeniacidonis]